MLKDMKLGKFLCLAALFFAPALASAAQDQGYWRAASNTAKAITGDIGIAENSVNIDFVRFSLASIRTLKPVEVAAAFDADVNSGATGQLYRLNVPPDRRFLHHNTLCGSQSAQWMATYVSGRTLNVAFFSGEDEPLFTIDALSNSSAVCATFSYTR